MFIVGWVIDQDILGQDFSSRNGNKWVKLRYVLQNLLDLLLNCQWETVSEIKCGIKDYFKVFDRNNWIYGGIICCLENFGEGVNLFKYNQNGDIYMKEID